MINEPKRSNRGRDTVRIGTPRPGPKKPHAGDTLWMESAACRGENVDMFFLGCCGDFTGARRICERCPVRSECLAYAMDQGLYHGIWGGLTTAERRRVRRKRQQAQRAARA